MLGIITDVIRPPQWFIAFCKWSWGKRELFWGAMILGVAANLCASWLVTPFSASYQHSPIGWAKEHPIAIFLGGISILALNVLVYVGTLFDRGSEIQTERKFLRRMEDETRVLRLTGIPADLIAPGVPLDEVFIPLRFRTNWTRIDLPLTEPDFPSEPSMGDNTSTSHDTAAQERARIRHQAATSSWQRPYQEQATISITDLWQMLTPEQPAVVIQGYPGMGKSTLLNRLTLHMARRGLIPDRLGRPTDPLVLTPQASVLSPILVPLPITLSEYAAECKQNPNLSLTDFMEKTLRRLDIRQLGPVVEKRLAAGRCLIMLDGLDEVSDPQTRSQVQQAIATFVRNWSGTTENRAADNFNRFLITSRVAGFDPNAFPEYSRVIIANLTPDQIEDFLPRWCRASVRRDRIITAGDSGGQEAVIAREAAQQARLLSAAIHAQQGVRELAVNPLLLTLLAVMQQNSIELPRQRVELYRIVTQTLLENRNIAKGLPEIAESEAILRLGPLAYRMQDEGKHFIAYSDVLSTVAETIRKEQGGTPEQAAREAETFIKRVRERSGLFVQRTDDYYGFFHRTFQEYFAARHLLDEIAHNRRAIADLAALTRRSDELWREPVLFAVAYKSKEGGTAASEMIQAILDTPPESGSDLHLHDLVLAGECVIEAQPLTIDVGLSRHIAEEIVQVYVTSYRVPEASVPSEIEDIICRWLLSVHQDAYQHPLLDTLTTNLTDSDHEERLQALLTLLAMIAERLGGCRDVVFRSLLPPLEAIAGLSEVDSQQPDTNLGLQSEAVDADLALSVLARLQGTKSPAAELLPEIRRSMTEHPDYLRALAQSSVESQVLMTPTLAPLELDARKRYDATLLRWRSIRDPATDRRQAKNALAQSMSVHEELLSIAERARYPISIDLLHLLQAATDHPTEPWRDSWQAHLSAQLAKGRYATYETATLLWLALLPQPQTLAGWAAKVTDHFTGSQLSLHRCARRILTMVSDAGSAPVKWDTYLLNDFDYLLSQQDADFILRLEDRLGMRYRRFPHSWQDLRGLLQRVDDSSGGDLDKRYRQTLPNETTAADMYYPRSPALLRMLYAYQQVGSWQDPLGPHSATSAYQLESAESPYDVIGQASMERAYQAEALGELRRMQDRRLLRRHLFTRAVSNYARALLTNRYEDDARGHLPPDSAAYTDLLVILRGRMIQLTEADQTDTEDALEIEQSAQTALALLATSSDARTVEACCNLLRSLPIRCAAELALVLRLVTNTRDSRVHEACAHAVLHATPRAPQDWTAFAGSVAPPVTTVQAAIDARLDLIYAVDDQLRKLTEPRYQRLRAHPTIGQVAG